MGLDMYLYKKTYVKNWEHNGPDGQHKITVKIGNKVRKDIKPERITYITEEVAYWRKFNALHNWFVEKLANGEDDCQELYVSKEVLEELLATLEKVSKILNKANLVEKKIKGWDNKEHSVRVYDCEKEILELFPPAQGFFFGGYEIDEWYKEEVEEAIETIENLLSETSENIAKGLYGGDFYYQASW